MRFLISMQVPTDAGNKIIQDGVVVKNVEDYIKRINAEAALFLY
jgi:hypothetical protein